MFFSQLDLPMVRQNLINTLEGVRVWFSFLILGMIASAIALFVLIPFGIFVANLSPSLTAVISMVENYLLHLWFIGAVALTFTLPTTILPWLSHKIRT